MIIEQAIAELEDLLIPLEAEAVEAVIGLVRTAVAHPDGVVVAARRAAEALAAKAFIAS
jgi:hypothetical protein